MPRDGCRPEAIAERHSSGAAAGPRGYMPARHDQRDTTRRAGRRRPVGTRRTVLIACTGLLLIAVMTIAVIAASPLPGADAGQTARQPAAVTAETSGRATIAAAAGRAASPAPAASSSPSTQPARKLSVTVACGGDVMGAWGVDSAIRSRGADYVMKSVKRVLKPADIAFVNAESPFSTRGSPQTWKDVYFRGNPALVPAMARAGIDVVTMANNHCLDYKAPALLDSIRRFNRAGIKVVGAGRNATEAWRFRYVTRNGLKVGFMGWTDIMPPGWAATSSSPGAAVGSLWSGTRRVRKAIRSARKKADVLVVAFHWGVEGTHYPIAAQIQEAHAAIDAGADLVMSHHPHWLQGIERYHGGLIMYSFGDLVFPPLSRAAAETVIMTSKVSERWITATITPYLLDGSGVPRRATGRDARSILRQLDRFSRARGTRLAFDWAHQRATVKVKRR